MHGGILDFICAHQSNFVNYKFSIDSSTIASIFVLSLWFDKKLLTIPFALRFDLFIDDVAICIGWQSRNFSVSLIHPQTHTHARIALKWTVLLTLEFYYTILLVIRYYQLHSSHSFAIVLDGMLENGVVQILFEVSIETRPCQGLCFCCLCCYVPSMIIWIKQ